LTFIDTFLPTHPAKQMQGVPTELKGYLRTFQDVLIKDNTIVRVHSYLAEKYPATRSHRVAAGIKVSVLLSVVCNGPCSVTFFPEKTNDIRTLTIGPWVKDRLLLMDWGFFKYDLFAAIDSFHGRFVTRIKANTTASIVALTLDTPEHLRHRILGADIHQAMTVLQPYRQDIDALVTIRYGAGKRHRKHAVLQVRFIALYNALTDDYHTFFTNIPARELPGRDIGALYAARWDIENLFRELKSENLLGRLQSKKGYITEIFLRIPCIRLILTL